MKRNKNRKWIDEKLSKNIFGKLLNYQTIVNYGRIIEAKLILTNPLDSKFKYFRKIRDEIIL